MNSFRESNAPSSARARLGSEPLRYAWALKMLYLHAAACSSLTLERSDSWACLTEMRTESSRWDRSEYPESERIVALDGNDESLLCAALERAHLDGSVFKVADPIVRSLVAALPGARLARTFFAFSVGCVSDDVSTAPPDGREAGAPGAKCAAATGLIPGRSIGSLHDPADARRVEERRDFDAESLEMFANNGYTEDELAEYRSRGASWFRLQVGDQTLSACLVYETYPRLWEIGGVYTLPAARGRGYAQCVVAAAATALSERHLGARYVCRSDNAASRAVAEGVGLKHDLTVEHFMIGAKLG